MCLRHARKRLPGIDIRMGVKAECLGGIEIDAEIRAPRREYANGEHHDECPTGARGCDYKP